MLSEHGFGFKAVSLFINWPVLRNEEEQELSNDAERSRNSREIIPLGLVTRGTPRNIIFPLELPKLFSSGGVCEACGRRDAERGLKSRGNASTKRVIAFYTVESSLPKRHEQTSSSVILTRHLADLISFLSSLSPAPSFS